MAPRQKPIARNKKNYRASDKGAGMTKAGIAAHRRANPGSKLKGAVTGKVKAGSKTEAFEQIGKTMESHHAVEYTGQSKDLIAEQHIMNRRLVSA